MSVERRSFFFFRFFSFFFFFKARYTRGGPIEQTLRVTRLGEYAGRVILHIEKPARTRACVTTTTTMKEREEKKKICGPIPGNDQTDGPANISRCRQFYLARTVIFIEAKFRYKHSQEITRCERETIRFVTFKGLKAAFRIFTKVRLLSYKFSFGYLYFYSRHFYSRQYC